jgi:hypothetical protein
MESHLAPVACVHIRGVSAIQEAGLEGFHFILDGVIFKYIVTSNSR